MKILRTRMISYYPHICLEAEAEKENGEKVYVNISLPFHNGEKIDELLDDNWWSYIKPLHEADIDEDHCYDNECKDVALKLIEIWNANPIYKETPDAWKGEWNS